MIDRRFLVVLAAIAAIVLAIVVLVGTTTNPINLLAGMGIALAVAVLALVL